MHHVLKLISSQKAIVVITAGEHRFHDYIYIVLILLLWDLNTLYVVDLLLVRTTWIPCVQVKSCHKFMVVITDREGTLFSWLHVCTYIYIYLSIYLSIYLFIYLFIYLSMYVCIYLSFNFYLLHFDFFTNLLWVDNETKSAKTIYN